MRRDALGRPDLPAGVAHQDVVAEQCRRSLSRFVREGWASIEPETPLEWSWHHEALCLHVQAVLDDWREAREAQRTRQPFTQRIKNLLANVPPGSLKSRIVMVFAPAWMWLDSPDWSVICLSGNPDVVTRDSMACRSVIGSDWYQQWFRPQWKLSADQDAKQLFTNTAGGFRAAKGSQAKITGIRAHAIFNDDPNDMAQVWSEAHRTQVNRSWRAASNRVKDQRIAVRVGIMQRGHALDWSGYILAQGGWEHLCIPTEFDPKRARTTAIGWSDPRKVKGEVIHPERYTPEVLAEDRRVLGSAGYEAQHNQFPSPDGGGLFQRTWWRFWRHDGLLVNAVRPEGCYAGAARLLPAKFDGVTISLDAAFKAHDGTDYVVFTAWGKLGADRFLVDYRRGRWTFGQTKAVMRELAAIYPNARKLVEDKANGPAIIDDLQREITGLVAVNPEGGKESRAAASSPQVESGNVYLPDGAPFLEDWVGEFDAFPTGAHDDIVDSTTQALIAMAPMSAVERARAQA